ncbi:DUF4340 domain-containing protein [Arenimonas sp.]|uniref:DUF4340 domain-containing protein n=1 Tax=Arenimonas sp. TaxID=1872635 RepID=UPI0035B30B55
MRARQLLPWAVAVLVLAGLAWWALDRQASSGAAAAGEALPGFAARIETLERIEVRGAGDTALVTLVRGDGRWEILERAGWPANEREISRALYRLGQARRVEAKTDNPALHARLGVEDISSPDAKGAELRFTGGGEPMALVVGSNHPMLGGSYARLAGDPQAWLLDEDLAPARDPANWLDRRLADLPLARIQRVRVSPAAGRAFSLVRKDDGFALDGAKRASDVATATAGTPEQLALDDFAADDGTPAAAQTAVFESVDGVSLTVASWQDERGLWARLSVALDREAALAWFAKAEEAAEPPEQRLAALEAQLAEWRADFSGRRFLLPPHKAANLLRSIDEYREAP